MSRFERSSSHSAAASSCPLRTELRNPSTGKYFAPRLLGAFLEAHPSIEVSLQIHNRHALTQRLAENADDL
ncbi:MAG: LysR substrate-binding domain-containing protein [Proteobacteria bacterium]|nr:LysR substrate-binding domain-containing protein [Pseudomonadota bacterium]